MATFVAFLRAINLGATRPFPRAAIVEAVEGAGCTDVATYLNTGNVRLDTTLRSPARIEARLERAFAAAAGFEVPTVVLTPADLRAVVEAADGMGHDGRHYVSLLKQAPSGAGMATLNDRARPGEEARATGRAVHLLLESDYRGARLTNALVEKHLGVATNRNLTVVRALVEKWC